MKNKKVVIGITSIVAVLLVIIGVTYAYWLVTRTQTNENVISTGCLDITLNGEKNDIELTNQFPLSDTDGMKLEPYEFTVTNNCTTSVDYHINLESMGDSSTAIKASAIKAVIDTNTPRRLYEYVGADTTIRDAYESYTLLYGTLGASNSSSATATYKLRLWIDADAPISEQNKTFTSKITVSVGQNISSQGDTLASLILADAEENSYLYTSTPDFSKVTSNGEYGLYSTEDDLGTSYYFRGDVENNYVKFGTYNGNSTVNGITYTEDTPIYWRILRVNGDGTIRIIYDGTTPVANGVTHSANITISSFNDGWDNPKYSGYTYNTSDNDNTQIDSIIKGKLDTWYSDIIDLEYGKYVADSIFCNDHSSKTESGIDSYYGAYDRLEINKSPQLTCTNKRDRYTVSASIGNGLLTSPIGLINADEVIFAGGNFNANNTYYLYSNEWFWTSSPTRASGNNSVLYAVVEDGNLFSFLNMQYIGVRPVINLKADVKFTGNGRIDTDTPYEIVKN